MSNIKFTNSNVTNGNTTWGTISNSSDNYANTLTVKGDAKISGSVDISNDLRVDNISILETLEKINQRLAILKPNPELEQRWEKLRELRQQYIDLEKDILEKEQIINILKR